MADIAACPNAICNRRDTCRRALITINPDKYQSYSDFPGGEDCPGYWEWEIKK